MRNKVLTTLNELRGLIQKVTRDVHTNNERTKSNGILDKTGGSTYF